MKAILWLTVMVFSLLLWSPALQAQEMEPHNPVYRQLAAQGRMTTGQITEIYGVPCVEVMLHDGENIMAFVHSIPALKKISLLAQDRISLLNRTHYLLVVNGSGNISTEDSKIFVPLDYAIKPRILPEFLSDAANHEKYILIDRRQQYLGLYEWGHLQYCYPISSGAANSTPLKKFVVLNMDEVHFSNKYEAHMDHALNIGDAYFIHEGIVPGYPASHGCFPSTPAFSFISGPSREFPARLSVDPSRSLPSLAVQISLKPWTLKLLEPIQNHGL